MFLCSGFWNSSKGPFVSGEIPLGSLDLGWSLERDQALSLWSGSTDSKTLDYERTNPAAACRCQVASVVSDSVRLHRRQPTKLLRPWDSPGKNTGVGCHFLLQCMKVESESEVTQSCLTLSDPWTAAYQAPPSMGLSGQQYWSGLPFLSPMHER